MTDDEKVEQMQAMLDEEADNTEVLYIYLSMAKRKILNRRYPFGYEEDTVVEPQYEQLQIELAICLFNLKGAEGQSTHTENGVNRVWRKESDLLQTIVPYAGVPKL